MYVQEPHPNTIDPSKMNLDVDGKIWHAFQAKCTERGEIPSEQLEQLMKGYVEGFSSSVESDLDRLVSDYVKQKIDGFLEQNLEHRISKLFDHYLKLHLKTRVQAQLQTSIAFSETDKVNLEPPHQSQTDDSNPLLSHSSPQPKIHRVSDPSVTQSKTHREKTSLLKTAKELAKILDISTPYIATLNRIGELEKRGWKDSGQRRGKSILYEPIELTQS